MVEHYWLPCCPIERAKKEEHDLFNAAKNIGVYEVDYGLHSTRYFEDRLLRRLMVFSTVCFGFKMRSDTRTETAFASRFLSSESPSSSSRAEWNSQNG